MSHDAGTATNKTEASDEAEPELNLSNSDELLKELESLKETTTNGDEKEETENDDTVALDKAHSKEEALTLIDECVKLLFRGSPENYKPKDGDLLNLTIILNSCFHSNTEKFKLDIAERLVTLKFGAFYKAVIVYCNGMECVADDEKFALFTAVENIVVTFTDISSSFCIHLTEFQVVEALLQNIKKILTMTRSNMNIMERIVTQNSDSYELMKVFYSYTIDPLYNIIKEAQECKPIYQQNDAIQILRPLVSYDDADIQATSCLILARIIEEEQSNLLADAGCFDFVAQELNATMMDRYNSAFNCHELVTGLSYLASYDKNKLKVLESGVLPNLIKMMKQDQTENQLAAINCVWKLAFLEECRVQLDKDNDCTAVLETLTQSKDPEVQSQAKMALKRIRGSFDKETSKGIVTAAKSQEKHIFVSYAHKNKETVRKIAEDLKQRNFKIWIDKDYFSKERDLRDGISQGIEEAEAVVIFMSEHYGNSNMCREELCYARKLKVPVIPVKIQRRYDARGWLGLAISNEFFITIEGNGDFFSNLVEHITYTITNKSDQAQKVVDDGGHQEQTTVDTVDAAPQDSQLNQEFDRWAEENRLNQQTVQKLYKEDLTSFDILAALTDSSLDKLELPMGQTMKLSTAISKLKTGQREKDKGGSKVCIIM